MRQAAIELQDMSLISKLSAGDMIAQEAKYHKDCFTALYNKVLNNSDELESKEGEISW